jgi:hypothetical protein
LNPRPTDYESAALPRSPQLKVSLPLISSEELSELEAQRLTGIDLCTHCVFKSTSLRQGTQYTNWQSEEKLVLQQIAATLPKD